MRLLLSNANVIISGIFIPSLFSRVFVNQLLVKVNYVVCVTESPVTVCKGLNLLNKQEIQKIDNLQYHRNIETDTIISLRINKNCVYII